MDAESIVAGWKRRLVALANAPDYMIADAPAGLVDEHYRSLTNFRGYPEADVADAESRLGVTFPEVFRVFLREMGQSRGDLFRGSDIAVINEFEEFRVAAMELLAETDPSLALPPDAVVFMFHQGYTFMYLVARGGFDSPPFQWIGTHLEPDQVAAGFAELVDDELGRMEVVRAQMLRRGGYLMSLHQDGVTLTFPRRERKRRPLSRPRRGRFLRKWW
jgi:hypothetical protein